MKSRDRRNPATRNRRIRRGFAGEPRPEVSTFLDFQNKSVIVTGAGSGIGRASAIGFAAQGAKVLLSDISPDRAEEVRGVIQAEGGISTVVVGDVSDLAVIEIIVNTAMSAHGGIDVLVNNAGIMDSMGGNDEVSTDEWDRVMRVNLTAPFLLTRAVVPHMLAKGKGAIVNIASEAGLRGSCAGTPYTVSKHGLIGLTKSDAVMYRNRGIRVNAVAPGAVKTNIQVVQDPQAAGPKIIGAYMSNMGRIAEPAELAAAIIFLASDAASDITGAILPVDGGWSAV